MAKYENWRSNYIFADFHCWKLVLYFGISWFGNRNRVNYYNASHFFQRLWNFMNCETTRMVLTMYWTKQLPLKLDGFVVPNPYLVTAADSPFDKRWYLTVLYRCISPQWTLFDGEFDCKNIHFRQSFFLYALRFFELISEEHSLVTTHCRFLQNS